MQRTLQKMANGEDKVLVAYSSRMKKKIAKYGENFSNDKFLLHVPIILDPRYKMKCVKSCFDQV